MQSASSKKIIVYTWIGFAVIICFLWIDEILDIPHVIFNAPATPINWHESLFETVLVAALAFTTAKFIEKCFEEIKLLQNISVVCTFCKRIKKENTWVEADISSCSEYIHGVCPDCSKKEKCGNHPQ